MQTVSRRQFLGAAAAGLGALNLGADPLGMPLGFQVYPIAQDLGKDFAGTLRMMAGLGYRSMEMCSPPGYGKNFAPIAAMPVAEVKSTIKAAGMKCESCHYGFKELKENLDDRMAYAKALGLKYMVLSSFGLPKEATMDDWKRAAGQLNQIGEKIQKAGMQAGFHNHHFEFQKLDGVLIYDELMKVFDPKLIKMQFQVAVVNLGYQAADYMNKYPGRFFSLHLADWSSTEKKTAAVGNGVVDWKNLFAAAKKGGVKNYYVEMNLELMKASVPYLHSLKV